MRSILFFFFCLSANAALPTPRTCESATLPSLAREGFESLFNRVASQLQPHHTVNDAIAAMGKNAQVGAKFTYGPVGKDMSKEFVELWVDACDEHYVLLDRQRTDGDGRVTFSVDTSLLEENGKYTLLTRVVGDGSVAKSTLRVVDPGKKVAVFDIDGTLTSLEGDVSLEILYEIYHEIFEPPPRVYSAELTHLLRDRFGYEIVYLSGRPYFLNGLTRKWLVDNNFAPGTLKTTQNFSQMLPMQSHVGRFKSEELALLKSAGLVVSRAYGNAETDVFAYSNACIPQEKIFLLGKYSGSFGVVGLGNDFENHFQNLASVENGVLD